MESEGKAADVPAAAPEAATVKAVEEAAPAPAAPETTATTAELDKAQAEAAPTATNGNGVPAVQSEPVEKDIEGLGHPSQKVRLLVACSPGD
jgi:hypothetical protein